MVVGRRCEGQLVVLEEGEASDLELGSGVPAAASSSENPQKAPDL